MTPMIPSLSDAGMINDVLTFFPPVPLAIYSSSTYQVISMIGDVTFYFMPFLIAANAAKVFKVNQSLALFIAGVYLSPAFVSMVAKAFRQTMHLYLIPAAPKEQYQKLLILLPDV